MNSVILCEGFDDALLLGYFLHKTSDESKWNFKLNGRISDKFTLPKVNPQIEKIEVYKRKEDKAVICSVGGKNNFGHAIEHVISLSKDFPKERFENIIIVSDRDNDDVVEIVREYNKLFNSKGVECALQNGNINTARFNAENIQYTINIIPIVVPFEKTGAIETVLLDSLEESDGQDKLVVEPAKDYITTIVQNQEISKYLTTQRQQLKGHFSSVIAVTNPDKSTGKMDSILLAHEWETKPEIVRHFGIIAECLNK